MRTGMRLVACGLLTVATAVAWGQDRVWIARSNTFTQKLLDVQFEHHPENGSRQGLAKFDERISNPTLADVMAERKRLEEVLATLKAQQPNEPDRNVRQDLAIIQKNFNLGFRRQDF